MAQDKGLPDWAKFLDYNNIDSQSKQQFLKEFLEDELEGVARRIHEEMIRAVRKALEGTAGAENTILQAALIKRFGSVKKAVETGMDLQIQEERYYPSSFQQVTTREFSALMQSGECIKLVRINTTFTHDEVATDYISFVGTLKL